MHVSDASGASTRQPADLLETHEVKIWDDLILKAAHLNMLNRAPFNAGKNYFNKINEEIILINSFKMFN